MIVPLVQEQLDVCRGLIKKNVSIATEAIIWTLHHGHDDENFKMIGNMIIIDNCIWICSRLIILHGAKVNML